jgi:hypothetical protein
MSKKPITLSDLKERGLILTKDDATQLLPHITEISHRGLEINVVFGPDKLFIVDYDEDDQDEDEPQDQADHEKMIWEFNEGESGWSVIGDHNLDEDGNLTGHALEFYNTIKDEADKDGLPQNLFRQIPESQVGKGDSSGRVRMLLDLDDDEQTIMEAFTLTEEQEANLMLTIGITTENTPEEYLNALNTFIAGIDGEVPPKILSKRTQLEEVVSASQSENSNSESKKEHYLTKRKRLKDAGLMEYTITQEDVDNSKYAGKVGDVIEIPIPSAE